MEPTLKETRESNEGTRGEESSVQRKQHMQRPWGRDLCWRGNPGRVGPGRVSLSYLKETWWLGRVLSRGGV